MATRGWKSASPAGSETAPLNLAVWFEPPLPPQLAITSIKHRPMDPIVAFMVVLHVRSRDGSRGAGTDARAPTPSMGIGSAAISRWPIPKEGLFAQDDRRRQDWFRQRGIQPTHHRQHPANECQLETRQTEVVGAAPAKSSGAGDRPGPGTDALVVERPLAGGCVEARRAEVVDTPTRSTRAAWASGSRGCKARGKPTEGVAAAVAAAADGVLEIPVIGTSFRGGFGPSECQKRATGAAAGPAPKRR